MDKPIGLNKERFQAFGRGTDIVYRILPKYGITEESTGMQWDYLEMVGELVSSFIREYAPHLNDNYEVENSNNKALVSDSEIDKIFSRVS